MEKQLNVTVWNERDEGIGAYPEGIHKAIASFLTESSQFKTVRTATLPQPEHGLSDEVLNDTDVLLWWGHSMHGKVEDAIVNKIFERVHDGMGIILLHSAHASKIFQKLMGTKTQKLRWREIGELERVWTVDPNHPITAARQERIEQAGGNSFRDYSMPQAIIRFKQGFGRLIRKETDTGAVAILDCRAGEHGDYRRLVLGALPNVRVTSRIRDIVQFMRDKKEPGYFA